MMQLPGQPRARRPLAALAGVGRLGSLMQAAALASELYQHGKAFYAQWVERHTYIIRVSSFDDLYPEIHRWLLDQMPVTEQRSLQATTAEQHRQVMPADDGDAPVRSAGLRYLYDGKCTVRLTLGGHPVDVTIEREERAGTDKFKLAEDHIAFLARSLAGQQRVLAVLDALARQSVRADEARAYIATSWGTWDRTRALTTRDPATVVLAPGVLERLLADLGRFLANEAGYGRIGLPWHRGYLFFGPPGTGKTSAALALAFAHKLDLYYLPLSDVDSDTKLAQLVAAVKPRSVLLIEDVDIAHAATSRQDTERLSLQGLLNALDGALTPHGLVTIMTTNDLQSLDPSLVRKGRCDVTEEIGYLTDGQLARLVAVMTGRATPLPQLRARQVAAAEIAEVVKDNIEDMDRARAALVDFLRHGEDARVA
jgi:chaperone BCS1